MRNALDYSRFTPVKVRSATGSHRPSWRDVLPVHPAAELFPAMTRDELIALGEDIKKNGLTSPLALWQDSEGDEKVYLLDGRNRLDAMEAVGLSVLDEYDEGLDWEIEHECFVLCVDNGDDPYAYVTSVNVHRRNLTTEQKREVIAKLLKVQPEKSDRQLGKMAGVDHKTVGVVRRQQEGRGDVPHVESRTDTKGRKQPSKRTAKREANLKNGPLAAGNEQNALAKLPADVRVSLIKRAVAGKHVSAVELLARREVQSAPTTATMSARIALREAVDALDGIDVPEPERPDFAVLLGQVIDRCVKLRAEIGGSSDPASLHQEVLQRTG